MKQLTILTALAVSLLLVGCNKKDAAPSPGQSAGVSQKDVDKDIKEKIAGLKEDVKIKLQQEREKFVSEARKEMDRLNVKIAELQKQVQQSTQEEKARLQARLKEVEAQKKVAEQKLAELESAGKEKWEDLKGGASDALARLKQAVEK